MKMSKNIIIPEGLSDVLLHACCAPCSSAIVEWMLSHDIRPVIYYFNPNIYPETEYLIRKAESKRHAQQLGLQWIDDDYDHKLWLQEVCGLEDEPERGASSVSAIGCMPQPSKPSSSAYAISPQPLPPPDGKASNR